MGEVGGYEVAKRERERSTHLGVDLIVIDEKLR